VLGIGGFLETAGAENDSRKRPGLTRRSKESASAPRRARVVLSCSACGGRNYKTTRVQREGATPLKLSKFCKACNHHTEHIESK
jgi:large subunit ribosomal protein L33